MKIIEPSRVSSLGRLSRMLKSKAFADARYFIVVDENSYSCCLPQVISSVPSLQDAEFFEVPVGDACKDLKIAAQLWESLLESHADRQAVIVNLGGGSVCDLGGFVAAGYQRGIRYINIPTTLVGMIDAAIGGKTAVNLNGSKNQIGFFYQPEIVCIDLDFLGTLPQHEVISGVFEICKTFMVAWPERYQDFMNRLNSVGKGGEFFFDPQWVVDCAKVKSAVVKSDFKDHGIRHILNFGHTFGHAIESYSYQTVDRGNPFSHGCAVGLGMSCALYLSHAKLGLDDIVYEQYNAMLKRLTAIPKYDLRDTEELLAYMRQDKKNTDGSIRCVLMQELGAPVIDLPVDENEIRDALLKFGK